MTRANPYPPSFEGPAMVTRDGHSVCALSDYNGAFAYVLRYQSSSVAHACAYEGWGWRPMTPEEIAAAWPEGFPG